MRSWIRWWRSTDEDHPRVLGVRSDRRSLRLVAVDGGEEAVTVKKLPPWAMIVIGLANIALGIVILWQAFQ